MNFEVGNPFSANLFAGNGAGNPFRPIHPQKGSSAGWTNSACDRPAIDGVQVGTARRGASSPRRPRHGGELAPSTVCCWVRPGV